VRVLARLNGAGNREAPRTLGARHARGALYYDRCGYARVAVHAPHGRQSRSAMPPFGTKGSQVQILSPRHSKAADLRGVSLRVSGLFLGARRTPPNRRPTCFTCEGRRVAWRSQTTSSPPASHRVRRVRRRRRASAPSRGVAPGLHVVPRPEERAPHARADGLTGRGARLTARAWPCRPRSPTPPAPTGSCRSPPPS